MKQELVLSVPQSLVICLRDIDDIRTISLSDGQSPPQAKKNLCNIRAPPGVWFPTAPNQFPDCISQTRILRPPRSFPQQNLRRHRGRCAAWEWGSPTEDLVSINDATDGDNVLNSYLGYDHPNRIHVCFLGDAGFPAQYLRCGPPYGVRLVNRCGGPQVRSDGGEAEVRDTRTTCIIDENARLKYRSAR